MGKLMRGTIIAGALMVLLLGDPYAVRSGELRNLWKVDLSTVIKETGTHAIPARTVFTLRFSPDNKGIAVAVENYFPFGSRDAKSHLLVLDTEHPTIGVRQFEIGHGINDAEYGLPLPFWSSFEWTLTGDAILAGGEVIRLAPKACPVSEGGDQVDSSFVLGELYKAEERIVKFLMLDALCQPETKWNFARDWSVADVSLDRKIICVLQPSALPQDPVARETARVKGRSNDVVIVDPFSGKIVQRWPMSPLANGPLRFADQGRAICAGQRAEQPGRIPLRCWDVDTGKVIGEAPKINAGAPIAVATRATRLVASDYRHIKTHFADDDYAELNRRVVWDFRAGKEIVSWHPSQQVYDVGIHRVVKEFYKFAISPNGRYIVEGGEGILRLYEIVP